MAKVRDVLDALESIAPGRFAASWDKIGLQVGDPNAAVSRAVVSLDRSLAAVSACQQGGAELLLSHHPLIFAPVQTLDTRRHDTRTMLELAKSGIQFIAAHTNWDAAKGGVNDALAARLGLEMIQEFGMASEVRRYKLIFLVPADSAEAVAQAVSKAGAVPADGYHRCAFFAEGLSEEREVRVELVVPEGKESGVIRNLIAAHPSEDVAYDLIPLQPVREQPTGRLGVINAMSLAELVALVDERLETRSLAWGDPAQKIRKVAVFGGAADSEWIAAQRANADALITGEVKQHIALEASESGMGILSSGHYATEQPGVEALRDRMAAAMPEVEWALFAPEPGRSGRPFFGG